MKTIWAVILFAWLFPTGASAQSLPVSDIWVLEWSEQSLSTPRKLVSTGRYNNQPAFSATGDSLFFTMEQQDGQTDIARVDLQSGEIKIVLRTEDSEYSPTLVPGKPALSMVRVELPEQRQRLWEINLQNQQEQVLFKSIEPVGYHAWIDHETVALFILGESFDLHVARLTSEHSTLLARNIGRTLLRHPLTGELLFVDKNLQPWMIATANVDTGRQRGVMPLFPDVEDFAVDQMGRFWMGSGSKLYRSSDDLSRWLLMADLAEFNVETITRICISESFNNVAFVVLGY